MLLLAFIVISLVFGIRIFFPTIKAKFTQIGSFIESAVETGREFK